MPSPPDFVWDVRFSGSALIAGHSLSASFFLRNGHASLIALDTVPQLTLSVLFDQFFSSLGPWPSDILNLSLTDSSVFYALVKNTSLPPGLPQTIAGQATNLDPGLYVATTIALTLAGYAFPPVATRVAAIRGKGFTIAADLTTSVAFIDSNFLLLSGDDFHRGPHLALQSFTDSGGTGRSLFLSCGFTLFNQQFGAANLAVTTAGNDPPSLAATLSYAGTLGPFHNPQLSFKWSKPAGFQVTNFPRVPIPGVVLDILSLLKQVSKNNGCGDLADLVFKEVIDTSFFVKPAIATTKPAGITAPNGQVYVLINGYYKISVAGTLITSIDLPSLVLSLSAPSAFTFDGIVSKIVDTITQNGVAVLQQLWDDKQSLAKVMAATVAKEVMEKVLGNLICDELKQLLTDFLAELGSAALTTIGGALAAAGGAILSLGGACGGSSGGGGSHGGGDSGDPGHDSPVLATPTITGSTYSAGAVTVNWNGVDNAAGYEVQFVDSTRLPVGPVQVPNSAARTATFAFNPTQVAAGACLLRLRARADVNGDAVDSAYAVASIVKLTAPTALTLQADATGETVTAQWDNAPSAAAYVVTIGQAVTAAVAATIPRPTGTAPPIYSIAAALFAIHTPGPYSLTVQAQAGQTAIPSNTAQGSTILTMLPSPTTVQQSALADSLGIVWAEVADATGYRAVVINIETGTQAVNVTIPPPVPEPDGFMHATLAYAAFIRRTPGRHRVAVTALGDTSHIAGAATASITTDLLFAGIGFTQVGTRFTVS
jgi:hypothetical protein